MPVAGGSAERDRSACKSEACKIQDCLSKNDYDVRKCSDEIAKLKKCCEKYQGVSIHCGFDPEGKDSATTAPQDQVFKGH
jgi:hypothetical protein